MTDTGINILLHLSWEADNIYWLALRVLFSLHSLAPGRTNLVACQHFCLHTGVPEASESFCWQNATLAMARPNVVDLPWVRMLRIICAVGLVSKNRVARNLCPRLHLSQSRFWLFRMEGDFGTKLLRIPSRMTHVEYTPGCAQTQNNHGC